MKFKPTVDLFAADAHHQLSCYVTSTTDAFTLDWHREQRPYLNHPWSYIDNVVNTIIADKAVAMMVIPDWRRAPWYPVLERICTRNIIFAVHVFLDDRGQLRPKPSWNTLIGIVDGTRA